jgi:hypothetical protein
MGISKRRRENNTKMDLKYDGVVWDGFIWFKVKSSCEHGNEASDSTKCWEIVE